MVQEENMNEWLELHIGRIILVIGIGAVVYFIFQKIMPKIIKRTIAIQMRHKSELEIKKRANTISLVARNTVAIVIVLFVLFTILAEVGVNIGPALASIGIVGLAIGFGAQSLVKDIVNGFFILIENQYGVGDVVTIAGISGSVEEINLRRTVLRDLDGIVHYIPNGEIGIASNFTREYSRVNINISVAYGENLDRVIKVINRICAKMAGEKQWQKKILKVPQVLRVDKLAESGVEIKILGDTIPLAQWDVMGELRKRLKNGFDKEGVEIPWPHMKVYFGNPLSKKAP
jgi:small conductance mechanosensitive channel